MHLKSQIPNFALGSLGVRMTPSAGRALTGLTSAAQYFARAWWFLRQVTGDAAYENYLRRAARHSHSCPVLTREEFYLDALRRRYTGVSRCC